MRILRGSLLGLCLPLLMAAALADTVPDATLRLVPTGEASLNAQPPAPAMTAPAQALPQLQTLSFGPQKLTFPGNVTASFDLVYGSLKGFRPLTLDIYQPPSRNTAVPLVVFVHGGGWNGGDTPAGAVSATTLQGPSSAVGTSVMNSNFGQTSPGLNFHLVATGGG